MANWPVYGHIDGPVVIIGYGSIGIGALPLIQRHFTFDPKRLYVIDPDGVDRGIAERLGAHFVQQAVTPENYRDLLTRVLTRGGGRGFCINLSVNTSSLDIMKLCREIGALYIDTVVEPWPGFYYNRSVGPEARTNNTLRETVRSEKARNPGGSTAVSCCGANPGMVSWFVKQALINLATDAGDAFNEPEFNDREGWARLMRDLGVKGIHVSERDTQRGRTPKPVNVFVNTWSVDGFISEGLQPAELGYGTHERWMPENAQRHTLGNRVGIYLLQPGANTRVRTWCPTPGPQFGFLVTHNEALSIPDYFTLREEGEVVYRPTCHYAYHPSDDAVLSIDEMFGRAGSPQPAQHILEAEEIVGGVDELGVLLYGHARNAYWYGSRLSIEGAKALAPDQNATGLQVTSAVIAGMVWALENPTAGIVEADEMDYHRCLSVQGQYLGPVSGFYTKWTPLEGRPGYFPEDIDTSDPWQFRNVLVR